MTGGGGGPTVDGGPGGSGAPAPARPSLLPDGALLGVATAGYQIEGGYNGVGQPANNWATWERLGRVAPSGVACDFWAHPEVALDRAASLGINALRLSVEWARIEPAEGQIDETALDHYGLILAGCHDRGLTPIVTLHHFTQPWWLGDEFWLMPGSPERFAEHVARVVARLGDRCRHWVTVNEPNALALAGWVLGIHPPGRYLAVSDAMAVVDNLLVAHVLAYRAIHRVQPAAVVTVNPRASTVYEFDQLLADLLVVRQHGVAPDEVDRFVDRRRRDHDATVAARSVAEGAARRVVAGLSPFGPAGPSVRLPGSGRPRGLRRRVPRRVVDVLYQGPDDVVLDQLALDWYDPVPTDALALPGRGSSGGRTRGGVRAPWDAPVRPEGLAGRLKAEAARHPGRPVLVAENGLATRTWLGRFYPRRDGWDRARFLRAHLAALVEAAEAGVPVAGYLHWTLVDCYEWGSFEPRFGIFGMDRDRGRSAATWMDTDATGADTAGVLRRLLTGLAEGDRSVLAR